MMCSVDGCSNVGNFTFPTNESLRKKWLEAIKQPDLQLNECHGLCHKHFKPEDILVNDELYGKIFIIYTFFTFDN